MKSNGSFWRRFFIFLFLVAMATVLHWLELIEGILKRTVQGTFLWNLDLGKQYSRRCLKKIFMDGWRTESNQNSSPCEPSALRWAKNGPWWLHISYKDKLTIYLIWGDRGNKCWCIILWKWVLTNTCGHEDSFTQCDKQAHSSATPSVCKTHVS